MSLKSKGGGHGDSMYGISMLAGHDVFQCYSHRHSVVKTHLQGVSNGLLYEWRLGDKNVVGIITSLFHRPHGPATARSFEKEVVKQLDETFT